MAANFPFTFPDKDDAAGTRRIKRGDTGGTVELYRVVAVQQREHQSQQRQSRGGLKKDCSAAIRNVFQHGLLQKVLSQDFNSTSSQPCLSPADHPIHAAAHRHR